MTIDEKWGFSRDEEHYEGFFTTREEACEEARRDAESSGCEKYFVGQSRLGC